ncbi:MAG TPA: TIGR03435 family protein [Bryobacteraceae bacterium]|jgi:uncharacterized protein (TIGR03435 family)
MQARKFEARNLLAGFAAALLLPCASLSQSPSKLEFEVASVKRNTTNGPSDMRGPRRSGDLVTMHNTQPASLIFYAYNLTASFQIAGYVPFPEGWNWFDIEARAGANATDDQIRLMFQSLLEDRFKLKVHHESRSMPQYELVIAKGKSKLTPARTGDMTVTIEGRTFSTRSGTCGTTLWAEGAHLICHAVTMEAIVSSLRGGLQAPVADRTGLTGTYDLNVLYLPDDRKLDPNAPPSPPLAEAIQEELGLRLEKTKGEVSVLVVDHIEKPSEN